MASLGVYPVFDIDFAISTTGRIDNHSTAFESMVIVAEMETFEPSIDGNVEEWTPMETEGWVRRLMTGKGFGISLSGKRHDGDAGNDYVAGLAMQTGTECSTTAGIKFPNGDLLIFDCVVNVSKHFGGDSTNVSALEFEMLSDGKPTYIESAESPAARTFTLEQVAGSSGTNDTTGIKFNFNENVNDLNANHIYITSGTGSCAKGTLSGSLKAWTLNIKSPAQGTVYVVLKGHTAYRFTSVPTEVTIFSK